MPIYTRERFLRVSHFRDLTLKKQHKNLVKAEEESNELLTRLLPKSIVPLLKHSEEVADHFDDVTILFADMAGFTAFGSSVSPKELVEFLNYMFSQFDRAAQKHGVYKVEIIGDCYYCVGGCPDKTKDHAERVALLALDMLDFIPAIRAFAKNNDVNMRIGMHTGSVVAGVVGELDPRYHLFGPSVNYAQNMESGGVVGQIQISETTYKSLMAHNPYANFDFEQREIMIKGFDEPQRTYFLTRK